MYYSIFPQMKILETKRCILRPATLEDANDMFKYYSKDIVVKFLPMNKHSSVSETKRFIKTFFLSNYKNGKIGHYAIELKSNNRVIGNIGFNNISTNATYGELGICLNPDYWGMDLVPELTPQLIKLGFEKLNLEKIIIETFKDNEHSRTYLKTLGFIYLGTFKKKFHSINSNYVICYRFEISRDRYFRILNKKI